MKLLFKAYACETLESGKRYLLPGRDFVHGEIPVGTRLRIKSVDGRTIDVTTLGGKVMGLDEKTMPFPVTAAFYFSPEVPSDIHVKGIELGADVFAVDEEKG